MGCGSSSASRVCADQELEAALANFPAQEVEGTEEKLGMGPPADKQFSNIRQGSRHPKLPTFNIFFERKSPNPWLKSMIPKNCDVFLNTNLKILCQISLEIINLMLYFEC